MLRAKTILFIPLCLLAAGCVATQQDMLQMQSQMDDLNTSINNMQKNQADLAVKMEDLSKNLNVSSENMKDISTQMGRLSGRLDELDLAMNKRVNAIGQTIRKQQEDLGQTLRKQQEEVETALLPAKLYNDAYNAYLNNSFDASSSGFKTYLAKFPTGEMAENSYFYMGESLYFRERWQDAALAYANVLEKFPKSVRVPAARLKYALALLKLPEDKKSEAVKYLHSVVRDFPNSQEAETARDHINRLSPRKQEPAAQPAKNRSRKG
ncbi:MAG TPA: tetratricopeptide repeat protein [Elusimicrobiales bacterium]|nr:tetratricopeptide repeat protein [Elusimicrobiales bacterium]